MFVIFYLKKFLQVTICPFLCRSPPKYVRAQLYHYHFTNENETTNYWRRDLQYEYLPLISPEGAAQLRATLTRGGVLPSNGENAKLEGKLADFLLKTRRSLQNPPHHVLVQTALIVLASMILAFWRTR